MPPKNFESRITDFTHAIGLLLRRLRAATGADEISMTEAVVLKRLENDGPATTAELARAEGMKPQSMGATVASLEGMNLVERKPHPTDGRKLNIELTVKGRALRKSIVDAKHNWLITLIAGLNREEQETLFKAGEIIRRLVEK
jgi:DNA-binding MarR family transcriptional regulator